MKKKIYLSIVAAVLSITSADMTYGANRPASDLAVALQNPVYWEPNLGANIRGLDENELRTWMERNSASLQAWKQTLDEEVVSWLWRHQSALRDVYEASTEIQQNLFNYIRQRKKKFQLEFKNLSQADITAICAVAIECPEMRELSLEGSRGIDTAVISNMLPNTCIRSLNLSDCSLNAGDANNLANALITPDCKIYELILDGNYIGDDGVYHISKALTDQNCELLNLSLCWNDITFRGVQHLRSALAKMHPQASTSYSLSTLNISGNAIGDSGAMYIADILRYNDVLQRMYLRSCNIGNAGATTIAQAFEITPDINGTKTDSAGNKVSGNETVYYLDFSSDVNAFYEGENTRIGDGAAAEFARILPANNTLTHLLFDVNCHIGREGGVALRNGVQQNHTLIELQLPREARL